MYDPYSKNPAKDARDQEWPNILRLCCSNCGRWKAAGLETFFGLLKISSCEAFSTANKVKIFPGKIEKLRRLAREAGEA